MAALIQIGIPILIGTLTMGLVPDLINYGLVYFRYIFDDLLMLVFYIERTPATGYPATTIFGLNAVRPVLIRIYAFLVGWLTLRFIWKGFKTYILCTEGDPDQNPLEMLKGSVLAIITAAIFPYLYNFGYKIVEGLVGMILKAFKIEFLSLGLELIDATKNIDISDLNIVGRIIVSAYVVCVLILMVRMLMRGCEMLIYRMGIPIAAAWLVEPDGGGWKDYISVLFRLYISSSVQYICLVFSMTLLYKSTTRLLMSFVFVLLAMNTPALLNQWMPASRSSGGGRLISTTMQASGGAIRAAGGAGRWVSSIFTRR